MFKLGNGPSLRTEIMQVALVVVEVVFGTVYDTLILPFGEIISIYAPQMANF